MSDDKEAFLSRWSRLKHEEKQPKPVETPAPPLPPLEKLTPQSDFTGFMHPKVEDAVRRVALKKLFSDPHFNIPDPFEAYSGDWTVGDPIPDEMLATLNQAQQLLFSDKQEVREREEEPKAVQTATAEVPPTGEEPGKQDT